MVKFYSPPKPCKNRRAFGSTPCWYPHCYCFPPRKSKIAEVLGDFLPIVLLCLMLALIVPIGAVIMFGLVVMTAVDDYFSKPKD